MRPRRTTMVPFLERLGSRRMLSRVIHVDANSPDAGPAADGSSWATAYVDLQQALAVATAGDEVRIADGVYKPTAGSDRAVTFSLKSGVAVYGGYAGLGDVDPDTRDVAAFNTTLSGDIGTVNNSSDNVYHIVTAIS